MRTFLFCTLFLALLPASVSAQTSVGTITVMITPKPANTFIPIQALGAGVDGLDEGDLAKVYTPANLTAMRSTGLRPLSYRLRTELGIDAWHWNPAGDWSAGGQGYWTSHDISDQPILMGSGYKLPRRGSTVDQANNDGYSRIDDGDPRTFWKSNPYLDKHFTGEDNALHPQWVLINLGRARPINAIEIDWGLPYAVRYEVQYWQGAETSGDVTSIDDTFGDGRWRTFPCGSVLQGKGGRTSLRLSAHTHLTRYVRVWMTMSSGGGVQPSGDIRDRVGYAVQEIRLGVESADGRLHDWVNHVPDGRRQTVIFASSTDPWHRKSDRDPRVEQPGFDRVFQSGLTDGMPVLIPCGVLYDTPDNAAAELRFLRSRRYPVKRMELGEEPDGQYCSPEDYGALYLQWADALHRVDPALALGGPSFQTAVDGWVTWPNQAGERSWLRRFLGYLSRRGHLRDFAFFSLEWYPFDDICAPSAPQLALHPAMLENALARLQSEGLSRKIPWLMTEYGYSAFAGQPEMELPGALLNAEIAAQFLTIGGSATYVYGYEPGTPIKEKEGCNSWGNLALMLADGSHRSLQPLPGYYAARLLTQQWAVADSSLPHDLYRAVSDIRSRYGSPLVTAYAVHRPDGKWAVLLLNKDPKKRYRIRVQFRSAALLNARYFDIPADLYQYGPEQYAWHPNKARGYPSPDLPPVHSLFSGSFLSLPPYSMTVLRGQVN